MDVSTPADSSEGAEADGNKNNTTIFLPVSKTPAPSKNNGKHISPATLSLVSSAAEDLSFMPLNINASHWACLVIDETKRVIYCYDNMNKRANYKLLEALAQELVKRGLSCEHQIIFVQSPIQKDSDNCGLFVCMFFWCRVDEEAGNDYTKDGLLRRRWDIFKTVVNFSISNGMEEQ
uniref:Ubiquitin-like protease family profile domain-containing protein n=1 Tax=Phytophthora ramorum TaxID=164328 RepID=H3H7N6_PHYRM